MSDQETQYMDMFLRAECVKLSLVFPNLLAPTKLKKNMLKIMIRMSQISLRLSSIFQYDY